MVVDRFSCDRDRSGVVRVYDDELANGHERLQLNADGSYSSTFTPKSGAVVTFTGRWEFDLALRYSEELLHEFQPSIPWRRSADAALAAACCSA